MFCKKCGQKIPDDSRFCPYCGTDNVMDVTEEPLAEGRTEPAEVRISSEQHSEKTKKKGNSIILWMIITFTVIGLAIYAAITINNPAFLNGGEDSIQVYVYSETKKDYTDSAAIINHYANYYLIKDGNRYAFFNPWLKEVKDLGAMLSIDGEKEKIRVHRDEAVLILSIEGAKMFEITYVKPSQSEQQKIIAEFESTLSS